ncbi:hypothetical protein, partial [Streptomyces sp. NRRL S-4]|uniref:hypothetical protein n=1 Tax=Streptomyces sp. NRRL S-4 TaxID=1519471 RepID=UPI0006CDB6E3
GRLPGAPAASAPAASTEYATRQEMEDLVRQVHQLTQIQLQLMGQLNQLLSAQSAQPVRTGQVDR